MDTDSRHATTPQLLLDGGRQRSATPLLRVRGLSKSGVAAGALSPHSKFLSLQREVA